LELVYIINQISQVRPINKWEQLSVFSCFEKLEVHPKGWLFAIKVKFYSEAEACMARYKYRLISHKV
jgi:hypothetical protein